MKSGIYKITSPSGRIYIGQSINVIERFKSYKRLETISQTRLHRSFLKHGVENHVFEIIEECTIKLLNERERFWQDHFDVLNGGLNCRLTTTEDKTGRFSEETRQKMSMLKKGKYAGDKNPMYGKTGINNVHSKKVIDTFTGIIYASAKEAAEAHNLKCSTLRAQLNGRYTNPTSLEYYHSKSRKRDTVHHNYGKKHKESSLQLMSLQKKGTKNSMFGIKGEDNPNSRLILDTQSGIFYYGVQEAADALGLNKTTLTNYLIGRRKNKTTLKYC